MKKYYFVSFQGRDKQGRLFLFHNILTANNASLKDIEEYLLAENDLVGHVVITCLKDLSKEEYKMLKGE